MSENPQMMEAIVALCDKLPERLAVLFTGAGVNAGARDEKGEPCPLGGDLSHRICDGLLAAPELTLTLDEAAEMARLRAGESAFNSYLHAMLASFMPAEAHYSIVQLPWDVIYTTNFDLLVERAASTDSVRTAGRIAPVLAAADDLSGFAEDDILYYKLHGCIAHANTDRGRLILTKEDYSHYELHRRPLFRRLRRDLLNRTLLFVGYSLGDPNFRAILEDCRRTLDVATFPRSFAIRPGFHKVEAVFWQEKYNLQLIDATADEFLVALKETWLSQGRTVVPFEERRGREYLSVDENTRLPKFTESYYRLVPADCTGPSNPGRFFKGGEPSWPDIRDRVAPRREIYWSLLEAILDELADPAQPPAAYLVRGHAGTGKSTLIRTLAFELADEEKLTVLIHVPNTQFDATAFLPLVNPDHLERIVLVIHHAAECLPRLETLMTDAKRLKLPLTVILEERTNQWGATVSHYHSTFSPPDFELGVLSDDEIEAILNALDKHGAMGRLTGEPRDVQLRHFAAIADKELLVALRELTSGTTFDNTIKDEFDRIPSKIGQRAYEYVAALGSIDVAMRYETLQHLLGIPFTQLREEVFQPTEAVLLTCEETGSSRHSAGFRLRARHPIIASIVFEHASPDDQSKFDLYNEILAQLDTGHLEDRQVIDQMVQRREFVNTFADPARRRAIYDRLASLLPNSAYVYQQRSILEKDLGDAAGAVQYARKAAKLAPDNPAIANTLGMALEFAARGVEQELPRKRLLHEAKRLFEHGTRSRQTDPFNHLGLWYILRQQIDREADPAVRAEMKLEGLSLLEQASEVCFSPDVLARERAFLMQDLGNAEGARELLDVAIAKRPTNERLRDLAIKLAQAGHHADRALELATEGEKLSPLSWRFQRHLAQIKQRRGVPQEAVCGHYEAAIRHHKGDIDLMVEYGAYLVRQGLLKAASRVFTETKQLHIGSQEKQRVRRWWEDEATGRRRVFHGTVNSITGFYGYILAVPENFEAFFLRTPPHASLKQGDKVHFEAGFNAHGVKANIRAANSK